MKIEHNNSNMDLKDFTKLMPIKKTLRFRLIPIGKTKETIEKLRLLDNDKLMYEQYPILKQTIDDFYRLIIKTKLENIDFEWNRLAKKYDTILFDEDRKILERTQQDYRDKVLGLFKDTHDKKGRKLSGSEKVKIENEQGYEFSDLFKQKLVTKILPDYLRQNAVANKEIKIESLATFSRFTTQLSDYWNSRKNIFSNKDISTALPFRLVNDNFPLFLKNIEIFNSNKDLINSELLYLGERLKEQGIIKTNQSIEDYFIVDGFNLVCTQTGIDIYNKIKGGFITKNNEKVAGINELLNLKQQQLKKVNKKLRKGKLNSLKKQILEYPESTSFLLDNIEDDIDLFNRLDKFNTFLKEKNVEGKSIYDLIGELALHFSKANAETIWISAKNITKLSNRVYKDWNAIRSSLLCFDGAKIDVKLKEKNRNTKKLK